MMTSVYSPLPSALARALSFVSALEQEQAHLQEVRRIRPLTAAQQKRLGHLGSDLDAITELFQTFSPRPWASPETNDVIENLHHASWWN